MLEQYNFKIDSELKKQLDNEQDNKTKSDFLEDMFRTYQLNKANTARTSIELQHFSHTSDATKENIKKSFDFIMSQLDNNFSSVANEQLLLNNERETLKAEYTTKAEELEVLKVKQTEEFEEALKVEKAKCEELNAVVKEQQETYKQVEKLIAKKDNKIKELTAITTQINYLDTENKNMINTLKEEKTVLVSKVQELTDKHTKQLKSDREEKIILENKVQELTAKNGATDTQLQIMQNELQELRTETKRLKIIEIENAKLIGKIEVLEAKKK